MSVALLSGTSIEELVPFKEVLEANGMSCEIRQKNIQVHQYYSSPGAILLIDDYNLYDAQKILSKFGNNPAEIAMNISVELSTEELKLKGMIRKLDDVSALKQLQSEYKSQLLSPAKIQAIFTEELTYILHLKENKFDWNEFFAALFEGRFFKYLNRNKSLKYEHENELIREMEKELD